MATTDPVFTMNCSDRALRTEPPPDPFEPGAWNEHAAQTDPTGPVSLFWHKYIGKQMNLYDIRTRSALIR